MCRPPTGYSQGTSPPPGTPCRTRPRTTRCPHRWEKPSDEPEVCGRRQVQGDHRDTRVVIRAIPRPASPVEHPSRGDDRLGGIDALYRDVLLRLTRCKIDPP